MGVARPREVPFWNQNGNAGEFSTQNRAVAANGSLLIAKRLEFVPRQLGHASPDITLGVYAHLFDGAEHAQRASDRLEASFGSVVSAPSEGGS